MTQLGDPHFRILQFYTTAPYACSYLPGHSARSQVATPTHLINAEVYGELVRAGFRRSGAFTYRPYCDACHACIPVRIPVSAFTPNRSQRRAERRHARIEAHEVPLKFREEHYALYLRYQLARHAGGGMDQDSREQYGLFLLKSQVNTRLFEFRENGTLCMVSLVDQLEDGLSCVYTFYEPSLTSASLGTFAIVWHARLSHRLGLPYLYLGYWIPGSRKMAYKSRFRPLEARIAGSWRRLSDAELDTGLPERGMT